MRMEDMTVVTSLILGGGMETKGRKYCFDLVTNKLTDPLPKYLNSSGNGLSSISFNALMFPFFVCLALLEVFAKRVTSQSSSATSPSIIEDLPITSRQAISISKYVSSMDWLGVCVSDP